MTAPHGRLVQRSMRAVLVVQAAALGLGLVAAVAWPGSQTLRVAPGVAVVLGTALLCGGAALRESERSRPVPAWVLLAVAQLGIAAQLLAAGPGELLGRVYLAPGYTVLTAVALWLLLRSALPPWRSGWWGDAAIVGLAGLALGATGIWPARPGTAHSPGADVLLGTAIAVGLATAALATAALAGVALTNTRPTWTARWVSAGLVLVAVSQTVLLRVDPGPQQRLLAVAWLAGFAVIGLATGPLDRSAPVTERRRMPGVVRAGRPLLSNVFLAIGVALLALAVLRLPLFGVQVPQVAQGLALACVLAALLRPALAERRRRAGGRDPAAPGGAPGRSPLTSLTTLVPAQAERWVGERRSAAALRRADLADGTDELTGLANRKALSEALASDGATARTPGPVTAATEGWSGWTDRIALLLVDLDRFKDVNEALGHDAGDQVLAQVGTRLREVLRPNQLLARLGGDEFAVVLPGAGPEPATRVAETLLAQLDQPVDVETASGVQPVYVRASVGIATCRLPRGEPADLLRQADVAVYRAKESGGGIEHFDPDRDQHGSARLRRINELRTALQHGDLEVFLQPQVDLTKGRVCGAEALARWRHPKDGVLLPAAFLPLAAQTGLMGPVSELVLDRALTACSTWWNRGYRVPVSVNLSADDLLDPDLTGRIPDWISEHDLPAEALQIEITEDVLLTDPGSVAQVLHRWRRLGIAVALDDYGTGYSSLAYLRELPIDELKLDRVFVADLDRKTTMTIVRHTVAMAHGLGMHVVAEGIEDRRTARALADAGCDIGQGLYFGGAMDPASFLTHLDMVTTS